MPMGRRGRGDSRIVTVTRHGSCYVAVDGLVTASLIGWSNGRWRVAVWGGDDHGIERDFDSEGQALAAYRRVGHCVTYADLRAQGYQQA